MGKVKSKVSRVFDVPNNTSPGVKKGVLDMSRPLRPIDNGLIYHVFRPGVYAGVERSRPVLRPPLRGLLILRR